MSWTVPSRRCSESPSAGSVDIVKKGRCTRAARSADARTEPPMNSSCAAVRIGLGVTTIERPRHSKGSPVHALNIVSRQCSMRAPRLDQSRPACAIGP